MTVVFEDKNGNVSAAAKRYNFLIDDSIIQNNFNYDLASRNAINRWYDNKNLRCQIVNEKDYDYRDSYIRIVGLDNDYPNMNGLTHIIRLNNVSLVDAHECNSCKTDRAIVKLRTDMNNGYNEFIKQWEKISYTPMTLSADTLTVGKVLQVTNGALTATSVRSDIDDLADRINKLEGDIAANNEKENKTMTNLMKNFECGKATDVKMSPFGPAFHTKDGSYAAFNGEAIEDVTGLTFDSAMCFLMPVGVKDVKNGDIIKYMGQYCKVREIREDGAIEAVNAGTATVLTIVPTKNIFGFEFMTKVMCPFGEMKMDADNPFGNPFMLMAMMDDKGDTKDNLMLMMAMSQMNGGETNTMNPWMMMALMK